MKRNKKNVYKVPDKGRPKKDFFKAPNQVVTKQNKGGVDKTDSEFLTYWHQLTPKQKLFVMLALLVASGITLTAIYYLLPSILASFTPKKIYTQGTAANKSFFNNHNATNESFLNKVAQVKVIPDPRLEKAIKSFPEPARRSMQKAIDKQIEITRAVLPSLIHPKILLQIIAEPGFTIEISHRVIIKALGVYEQLENKIYAAVDIVSDREFITRTLKNEFHTAAIRMQNFFKSNKAVSLPDDPFVLGSPYVDERWVKNPTLAETLHNTIKTSNKRMEGLIILYSKHLAAIPLTTVEQNIYNSSAGS